MNYSPNSSRSIDLVALKPKALILVSVLVIFLSIFVRAELSISTDLIAHDDAISLLSATGHQGEWERRSEDLAGTWLTAEEFKRFIAIEDKAVFGRIKDDLMAHDIHPPLYFWLLHLWLLIFPVIKLAGPTLNILIFTASSVLLYKTSKLVFCSTPAALAVVSIFAASPVAIEVSQFTRQYELWMLLSVALLYIGIQFISQHGQLNLAHMLLLSATLLLGMLTHYHFATTAVSIYIFFALFQKNLPRGHFALLMIAAIISALLFFVILPDFLQQLQRQQVQNQAFDTNDIFSRVARVLSSLAKYVGWGRWWPQWTVPLFAIGFTAPALYYASRIREILAENTKRLAPESLIVFSLITGFGIIFTLYIFQFSPRHAMGSRYIAGLVPLIALAIGLITRRLTRYYPIVLVVLSVWLLGNSFALLEDSSREMTAKDLLRSSNSIVLDNLARGKMFPLILDAPEGGHVFAAWRTDLVGVSEVWIERLRDGDLLVITDGYGNDRVDRSELIDLVSKKHTVAPATNRLWVIEGSAKLP